MPKRKEEIGTITTQAQAGMTPTTIPLGETNTKTPKGESIPIYHTKGGTTLFKLTFLALYVMSMDIILIISPKFLTSNG
jgi:hypothetical protein